jgi:hypothetical protein
VIREGRDYNLSGPGVGASISWNRGEDTFHFAYVRLVGDFDISGKITKFPDALNSPETFYSVFHARESLDPYSPDIQFALFNPACREFGEWGHMFGRDLQGATIDRGWSPMARTYDRACPIWGRLVRNNDVFTTFISKDGVKWNPIDHVAFPVGNVLYVGIGTTDSQPVHFRDLTIRGKLAPALAKFANGSGTGLSSQLFIGKNFEKLAYSRLDNMKHCGFAFGDTPDPEVLHYSNYSIRWTGFIEARFSEDYQLGIGLDDGGKLWIDDELLVDQWKDQGYTVFYAKKRLTGGRHKIRIDYYDAKWGGSMRLYWKSTSQPLELVPTSQFYPAAMSYNPPRLQIAIQTPPGLNFEAENGLLSGGAERMLDLKNASGGGYVGHTESVGSSVLFAHLDGGRVKRMHSVNIRYLAPEMDPALANRNIYVNGKLIDYVTFFGGDSWRELRIYVALEPGRNNTLEVRNETAPGIPWPANIVPDVKIDKIALDGDDPLVAKPTAWWPDDNSDVDSGPQPVVMQYERPTKFPDLVVTEIRCSPEHPKPGELVTLSAVIKNQGQVAMGDDFRLSAKFDVGGVIMWSDNTQRPLDPDATVVLTVSGGQKGPRWVAVAGKTKIVVTVNDQGRIEESNYDNNSREIELTVKPVPDSGRR